MENDNTAKTANYSALLPAEKISCDSNLPGMDFTIYYYFVAFNHGGCPIYNRPSSTFMKMFKKFIKTFYALLLTALNLPTCKGSSYIFIIIMIFVIIIIIIIIIIFVIIIIIIIIIIIDYLKENCVFENPTLYE